MCYHNISQLLQANTVDRSSSEVGSPSIAYAYTSTNGMFIHLTGFVNSRGTHTHCGLIAYFGMFVLNSLFILLQSGSEYLFPYVFPH